METRPSLWNTTDTPRPTRPSTSFRRSARFLARRSMVWTCRMSPWRTEARQAESWVRAALFPLACSSNTLSRKAPSNWWAVFCSMLETRM